MNFPDLPHLKQLQNYLEARDWWGTDKEAFKHEQSVMMGVHPLRNTAKRLGQFLARIALPRMESASESEWQELLGWLRDLRDVGAFPTVALPYVLLHRPAEAATVNETIAADIDSDSGDAVSAASKAIRHWVHLLAISRTPGPPPNLVTALIERVVFRRKPGINACLAHLSHLITEHPTAITASQAALLSASLIPWHNATILPVPDESPGDFRELERPDLRACIGSFASALGVWYAKTSPGTPEPRAITKWRALCASDPLPEIRRAFDAFNQVEPSPS